MAAPPQRKLGPYEVVAAIGAGGMGEVFRARDPRLGREVAVKLLPAALSKDAERLKRFEQEARAVAAITHPNIVSVFDVGSHEDAPYIVTELLDGETLRDRLNKTALPPRKAIDIALQVAQGLAAAHEKGIIHRDLKPENIFLTKDGRVKVLDFGLAKLQPQINPEYGESATVTGENPTHPGVVMGTVGYMSPEQVMGHQADQRSDLFSLGAVFYEMISGRRAFKRSTGVETMTAILKEDVPEFVESGRQIAPGLERIVRRCLEKSPEERFQSARDFGFALDALTGSSLQTTSVPVINYSSRRWWLKALAGPAALLAIGGAFVVGTHVSKEAEHSFRQATFRQGILHAARFAPDGQAVVYSGEWEGRPPTLSTARMDSPESHSLGLPPAALAAVSPSGELAMLLRCTRVFTTECGGTLAQAPLGGGAPREILENVNYADWSPDGKQLAVVIAPPGGKQRVEYPIGKKVYESDAGWLAQVRVSPDGSRIAFLSHPTPGDDSGRMVILDLASNKEVHSPDYPSVEGVAWSPDGKDAWSMAGLEDWSWADALVALDRGGKARTLHRFPGIMRLFDTAPDGKALLSRENWRQQLMGLFPGHNAEVQYSWLDWSIPLDLSPDGKTLLFMEGGLGAASTNYGVYLRQTDGSDAVRLGDGTPMALSPDGKWALASMATENLLVLLPTGPGQRKELVKGKSLTIATRYGRFFPDGRRIAFVASEPGKARRAYVQELAGGEPKAVTPELREAQFAISPDGAWIAARGMDDKLHLYPTAEGKEVRTLAVEDGELPITFTADGRSLLVALPPTVTARKLFLIALASGKQTLWKDLGPEERMGISRAAQFVAVTPDLKHYAYSVNRVNSELYIVRGLH